MAIQYRGTGTSGNSGASNVSTQAITLPTGAAAGDLLFVFLYVGNSGLTGLSQTGGTGTWTIDFNATQSTGGYWQVAAHRVLAATDTAPTFSWTGASGTSWSCGGFYSDKGGTLALDKYSPSDPLENGSAGTSITPNTAACIVSSEASIIGTHARSSGTGTPTTHTYTPPAGWTFNDGNAGFVNGSASHSRIAAHAYNLINSGTVTPGSQSLTDSAADTWFFTVYHALVFETLPGPSLKINQAVKRASLY